MSYVVVEIIDGLPLSASSVQDLDAAKRLASEIARENGVSSEHIHEGIHIEARGVHYPGSDAGVWLVNLDWGSVWRSS